MIWLYFSAGSCSILSPSTWRCWPAWPQGNEGLQERGVQGQVRVDERRGGRGPDRVCQGATCTSNHLQELDWYTRKLILDMSGSFGPFFRHCRTIGPRDARGQFWHIAIAQFGGWFSLQNIDFLHQGPPHPPGEAPGVRPGVRPRQWEVWCRVGTLPGRSTLW